VDKRGCQSTAAAGAAIAAGRSGACGAVRARAGNSGASEELASAQKGKGRGRSGRPDRRRCRTTRFFSPVIPAPAASGNPPTAHALALPTFFRRISRAPRRPPTAILTNSATPIRWRVFCADYHHSKSAVVHLSSGSIRIADQNKRCPIAWLGKRFRLFRFGTFRWLELHIEGCFTLAARHTLRDGPQPVASSTVTFRSQVLASAKASALDSGAFKPALFPSRLR
jgi:hypothetical protein